MTETHWHAYSERYTTGDKLNNALMNGWEIIDIRPEEHFFGGGRRVIVYHFHLTSHGESIVMSVVSTPVVEKMIDHTVLKQFDADTNALIETREAHSEV